MNQSKGKHYKRLYTFSCGHTTTSHRNIPSDGSTADEYRKEDSNCYFCVQKERAAVKKEQRKAVKEAKKAELTEKEIEKLTFYRWVVKRPLITKLMNILATGEQK